MKQLQTVDAIAGFNFLPLNADVSHIRWIHSFGAGVDSFMQLEKLSKHTILTRSSGNMGDKIGMFCLAYLIAHTKGLLKVYENQKERKWSQIPTVDAKTLNVLILGTGTIGTGVARQLAPFANSITGLDNSGMTKAFFDQISTWESIPSDIQVVINTLPSTPQTIGRLNEPFFKLFNSALFINVGRGDAVVEEDLILALERNWLQEAVLDVFETEPLPSDSSLWTHPKILISPHQSGITSADDLKMSFRSVYEAIGRGKRNELFVELDKHY